MKALLLGMNSPTGRCLEYDNFGAGRNLFRYSGLSQEVYEAAFDRMNLIQGKEWDDAEAKRRGSLLIRILADQGRQVVVLGNKVWTSLGLPHVKWMECHVFGTSEFYRVPHTSGKNLFYNETFNRKRLEKLLQRLAEGAIGECRKAS